MSNSVHITVSTCEKCSCHTNELDALRSRSLLTNYESNGVFECFPKVVLGLYESTYELVRIKLQSEEENSTFDWLSRQVCTSQLSDVAEDFTLSYLLQAGEHLEFDTTTSAVPTTPLDKEFTVADDTSLLLEQYKAVHKYHLLALRHAAKCVVRNDNENAMACKVPYCNELKKLWQHIQICSRKKCRVLHCISSRYLLAHYSKCVDFNCWLCDAVRKKK